MGAPLDRYLSGADPGFPKGGVDPLRGGVDLRHGHFSVKMYVETKELCPVGGGGAPEIFVCRCVSAYPFPNMKLHN